MRPSRIEPLARDILEELRRFPASQEIVLGGYFALQHYLDYRPTHDLDAWWRTGRSTSAMEAIRRAMTVVADRHGLRLIEREWGETVSFELVEGARKVFSFQIAVRSLELEEPHAGLWDPIAVETLADNVGAKMNALVQRGAPRDFLDVRELVTRGLVSTEQCWRWWSRKNPAGDSGQARANVLRHLEELEGRRPIADIGDPGERARVAEIRRWVREWLVRDAPEREA